MRRDILFVNWISGYSINRPEKFGFRRGALFASARSVWVIHEGKSEKEKTQFFPDERQKQGVFGCFSCDAGKQKHEKREQKQQQSIKPNFEGYTC